MTKNITIERDAAAKGAQVEVIQEIPFVLGLLVSLFCF